MVICQNKGRAKRYMNKKCVDEVIRESEYLIIVGATREVLVLVVVVILENVVVIGNV